MKNPTLFLILVFLLVMTFFFQEKRVEKEILLEETQNALLQEITHLKFNAINAEKKNNQWWEGNSLLSFNKFRLIEKKLLEIRKIKKVHGDWKQFSSDSFDFEVNHTPWALGDLSLDKQAFYVKSNEEIFLARIEGESYELTRNEKDIAQIKFKELLQLLKQHRDELLENQLFRFFPNIPLERIIISTESMIPFEINLKNNQTLPPPIPGISPHEKLKEKVMSLLTQVTIKKEIPYSEKNRIKKLGEIVFLNEKHKLTWELWLTSNRTADAVIVDPLSKRSFLMVGGTLKIFFVQIQDYWDKKVIPQKNFNSFDRLETTFTQGSKKAFVTLLNQEPLGLEVKGRKFDQAKLEKLFEIILNLGPRAQADRVSQLTRSEKKQLLNGEHLKIEIMGQELLLWRKSQELIVVNLTQGFKAHFLMSEDNFLGTFEDMLK